MNPIEIIVRSINGGVFANVSYTIPAKSYIRKGATDSSGTVNPLWDRAKDIRLVRNNVQINLGVIYQNAVNGRLNKKDIEPDFNAEAMERYGKTSHIEPHKNLCQNLDRSKTYLRYMPMQNKNVTSKFMLDGNEVTADLIPFMGKKAISKRQATAGLDKEEQIQWRTLDIANVTRIKILGAEITQ